MITVKMIEKFRNDSGKIIGYRLQDVNGQTQDMQASDLKNAIKNGIIKVSNLTLTSDNRLVDTAEVTLTNVNLSDKEFVECTRNVLAELKNYSLPTQGAKAGLTDKQRMLLLSMAICIICQDKVTPADKYVKTIKFASENINDFYKIQAYATSNPTKFLDFISRHPLIKVEPIEMFKEALKNSRPFDNVTNYVIYKGMMLEKVLASRMIAVSNQNHMCCDFDLVKKYDDSSLNSSELVDVLIVSCKTDEEEQKLRDEIKENKRRREEGLPPIHPNNATRTTPFCCANIAKGKGKVLIEFTWCLDISKYDLDNNRWNSVNIIKASGGQAIKELKSFNDIPEALGAVLNLREFALSSLGIK